MIRSVAAAICLCLAAPGASAADPVAFVADVHGNATIEGDGKVRFLGELARGTKLLLGSGSVVVVTYAATGTEYTTRGPGEFSVTDGALTAEKGAAPQRRVVSRLSDPTVVASAAKLATASTRMRGLKVDEAALRLAYPVDTRITTLRPTLRWQGGSDGMEVRVVDTTGKVVWKGKAATTMIVPDLRLQPGMRYTWSLVPAQGAATEARFETLGREAIARVERSQNAAKAFPDRVMHALLLQELGATQEAQDAWGRLAGERPDLPELANLAPAP